MPAIFKKFICPSNSISFHQKTGNPRRQDGEIGMEGE